MIDFINFMIDLGKFAFCVLVAFVVVILFIIVASKMDYIMKQRECYEIYAIDDVILKKCQKYFEAEE